MKAELDELLLEATREVVERLASKNERGIYAFAFCPSSGYVDLGVAYATLSSTAQPKCTELDADLLEMLEEHPDLSQKVRSRSTSHLYYEVNACEWPHIRVYAELFKYVNAIIEQHLDDLYDEGFESGDIERFFEKLLLEMSLVIRDVMIPEYRSVFCDDVLLGIQFLDSSSPEAVKRVSKQVNSPAWHAKLVDGYDSRCE